MSADPAPEPVSPLAPHTSTPAEVAARLEAARDEHPFVVWRGADGSQRLLQLVDGLGTVTIGRGERSAISLPHDPRASRLHAEIGRVDDDWLIADDGLSRNGTFVNDDRVNGRRRLRDGDLIRVGGTIVAFCRPGEEAEATALVESTAEVTISPAQRKVLVELCRPVLERGHAVAPPTNQAVAERLFLSVDAVKSHVRALMTAFGCADVPPSQRRAVLVERAVRAGVVRHHDVA